MCVCVCCVCVCVCVCVCESFQKIRQLVYSTSADSILTILLLLMSLKIFQGFKMFLLFEKRKIFS